MCYAVFLQIDEKNLTADLFLSIFIRKNVAAHKTWATRHCKGTSKNYLQRIDKSETLFYHSVHTLLQRTKIIWRKHRFYRFLLLTK